MILSGPVAKTKPQLDGVANMGYSKTTILEPKWGLQMAGPMARKARPWPQHQVSRWRSHALQKQLSIRRCCVEGFFAQSTPSTSIYLSASCGRIPSLICQSWDAEDGWLVFLLYFHFEFGPRARKQELKDDTEGRIVQLNSGTKQLKKRPWTTNDLYGDTYYTAGDAKMDLKVERGDTVSQLEHAAWIDCEKSLGTDEQYMILGTDMVFALKNQMPSSKTRGTTYMFLDFCFEIKESSIVGDEMMSERGT